MIEVSLGVFQISGKINSRIIQHVPEVMRVHAPDNRADGGAHGFVDEVVPFQNGEHIVHVCLYLRSGIQDFVHHRRVLASALSKGKGDRKVDAFSGHPRNEMHGCNVGIGRHKPAKVTPEAVQGSRVPGPILCGVRPSQHVDVFGADYVAVVSALGPGVEQEKEVAPDLPALNQKIQYKTRMRSTRPKLGRILVGQATASQIVYEPVYNCLAVILYTNYGKQAISRKAECWTFVIMAPHS